jgi:caffeoyl-CoA O-methyltransferase
MFAEIPDAMRARIAHLEEIDTRDRTDGTQRLQRLRQIPPETGKFIALLAASAPQGGECIEIGTSAGYSAMWLSLAMKATGRRLKTFEVLPEKAAMARETIALTGMEQQVELVEGDFLKAHGGISRIAFCFLDCEKEVYEQCFDIVAEKLIPGGLLVADNAINHFDSIRGMIEKAERDARFDCVTVPIGKGEFVCRRVEFGDGD